MIRMSAAGEDVWKDPETLEREIDQTRAQMDETLDALGRRLSPRRLRDESMRLIRDRFSRLTGQARRALEHQPLPVMLLPALGAVWMTVSRLRTHRRHGNHAATFFSDLLEPRREGDISNQPFVFGALAAALALGIGAALLIARRKI